MSPDIPFARLVREKRLELGMSQAALAELVGRSASAVRSWERGASSPSDESVVRSIAAVLGVDENLLRELVGLPPEQPGEVGDEIGESLEVFIEGSSRESLDASGIETTDETKSPATDQTAGEPSAGSDEHDLTVSEIEVEISDEVVAENGTPGFGEDPGPLEDAGVAATPGTAEVVPAIEPKELDETAMGAPDLPGVGETTPDQDAGSDDEVRSGDAMVDEAIDEPVPTIDESESPQEISVAVAEADEADEIDLPSAGEPVGSPDSGLDPIVPVAPAPAAPIPTATMTARPARRSYLEDPEQMMTYWIRSALTVALIAFLLIVFFWALARLGDSVGEIWDLFRAGS